MIRSWFVYVLMLCILAACRQDHNLIEPADLIFTGVNVVTMDPLLPKAEAVAVRGQVIIAVGSQAEVLPLANANTKVIELNSHALLPGFIDTHGHVAALARFADFANLSSPPVGSIVDFDTLAHALSTHIETNNIPAGDWVIGYGYDDSLLRENAHPTRVLLDTVSTEHPIYLAHVSGHLGVANSVALDAKGIVAETPDPSGGVIRRDSNGAPNGILEETAVYPFMPEFLYSGGDRLAEQLGKALESYAAYGTTTVQEGGLSYTDLKKIEQAAAQSPFPVDVVAYLNINTMGEYPLEAAFSDGEYQNGFRVGGIKFILDGSPQGRTAFVTEAYTIPPEGFGSDYVAYPSYDAKKYQAQVRTLLQQRTPFLVHANGDAAIDMMIEGIQQGLEGKALDHRSVIIHAQLMRDDQLDRAASLGIVPSFFSAHTFFWGDWHRISFGEERAANISPTRSAVERNVPFTIHNDTPVVPPDILRLIWATVNRVTRSGHIIGEHQRLTTHEALHAVTLGAAYQYFEEDKKGSITVGKQADLVILSANPLGAPTSDLANIKVNATYARGNLIYQRP